MTEIYKRGYNFFFLVGDGESRRRGFSQFLGKPEIDVSPGLVLFTFGTKFLNQRSVIILIPKVHTFVGKGGSV